MTELKNMKTSELLDIYEKESKKEDTDDGFLGELYDEITERAPFDYMFEQIEHLEKELKGLKELTRDHRHIASGEVVKRI